MYCSDDPKSGPCPVSVNPSENPGYGSMISFMQQIVSVTMHHADLRRVAQIIAWLEDQSMRDLVRRSTGQLADSLEEFGVTAGYTRQEAIQQLIISTTPSNLSSQDPDANSWYVSYQPACFFAIVIQFAAGCALQKFSQTFIAQSFYNIFVVSDTSCTGRPEPR